MNCARSYCPEKASLSKTKGTDEISDDYSDVVFDLFIEKKFFLQLIGLLSNFQKLSLGPQVSLDQRHLTSCQNCKKLFI